MNLTLPSLLFGFMIATLMGAAFHLWRGGNLGRLILYVILAWIGFWIGHFVGQVSGLTFGSMGPLRMGMGVLVGAIFLLFGYWLSLVQANKSP